MKKTTYISALFVSLLFYSCSTHDSVSNSTMFHGNETHTGVYEQANYKSFGEIKWKFKTSRKIFSSPAIVKEIAYVGSEDSNLYAVNIRTGQLQWKFHTNGAVPSSPAVYNNVVYFCSYDGYSYAVNATSGSMDKLYTLGPIVSSPAISGNLILFGSADSCLYAVELKK